MVHSFALVTVAILVMELFAKVSELDVPFEVMHYTMKYLPSIKQTAAIKIS